VPEQGNAVVKKIERGLEQRFPGRCGLRIGVHRIDRVPSASMQELRRRDGAEQLWS
jgi:hypothetical protein